MIDLAQIWEVGGIPMIALVLVAATAVALIVREGLFLLSGELILPSNLPVLAVCAAVAPLIGLLGTVMGLVQVFVINTSPDGIAGGISQALFTTQVGMLIAVPTLVARQVILRWRELRLAQQAQHSEVIE